MRALVFLCINQQTFDCVDCRPRSSHYYIAKPTTGTWAGPKNPFLVSRRTRCYGRRTTCSVRKDKVCPSSLRKSYDKACNQTGTNIYNYASECVWWPGSAWTHWGSLSAPTDRLAAIGGAYF